LPKPRVTQREVKQFLREYQTWLSNPERDYSRAEEMTGRLFTATVSGDREAGRLFRSMSSDARLDGAYGEEYETAVYQYGVGTKRPSLK
jgi:hypothetical protein